MILYNKHVFSKAQTLYERIFCEEPLEFEKVMATLRLVNIYSCLAREQWDPNESQSLYNKAHQKALFAESYILHNRHSGTPSCFVALSAFYVDNSHSYYDPKKAKKLLEFVFTVEREFSLKKTIAAKKC